VSPSAGVQASAHPRLVQLPAGVERIALGLSACCVGAAALGGASGVDVSHPGTPGCVFRAVTGLPCPFCGLTHSMMAWGQGDLGAVVAQNPLGLLLLPLAVVLLVVGVRAMLRRRRFAWPVPALWAGLALLVVSWAVQIVRYST
jgi:Protein of unknown function (DUF2752)